MSRVNDEIMAFEKGDHERDDGFEFMCSLEQLDDFHGDVNLQITCKELKKAASAHHPQK